MSTAGLNIYAARYERPTNPRGPYMRYVVPEVVLFLREDYEDSPAFFLANEARVTILNLPVALLSQREELEELIGKTDLWGTLKEQLRRDHNPKDELMGWNFQIEVVESIWACDPKEMMAEGRKITERNHQIESLRSQMRSLKRDRKQLQQKLSRKTDRS